MWMMMRLYKPGLDQWQSKMKMANLEPKSLSTVNLVGMKTLKQSMMWFLAL